MRDPALGTEPRSYNDLRVKPPHGRQTRIAFGLDMKDGDPIIGNGTNGNSGLQGNKVAADVNTRRTIPARSTTGLNGTYDELYRQQNGTAQPDSIATNEPPLRHGRPPPFMRARSDFGPRHRPERGSVVAEDELMHMRHGWEDEYTSNEYLSLLNSVRHFAPYLNLLLTSCRRSTCTTPTNDTTPVEYQSLVQKHGPTQIGE